MRNSGYITLVLAVALMMTVGGAAWSQQATLFTAAELDELFAPIALYPDPLLAQILPAATFPDQLVDAAAFQGGTALIDSQPWDVSVRSVAHYPSVLRMMADSPDWTTAVGQAYYNQPNDVMQSIQRLRGKARLMGYLNSNSQQSVVVSNGYISIVPASARYIYVPTYNPQVVYVQRRSNYGQNALYFGLGLLIGSWLNNNVDWHNHRVYNHGWRGGGWVGRSRSYAGINNRAYVNPSFANRTIRGNPAVRAYDISPYRQNVRRGVGTYRTPGLVRPTQTQPTPRAPSVTPRTRHAVPSTRPVTTPKPSVAPLTPGAGPGAPIAHPTRRPGAVRRAPAPRPGATVITPAPRSRQGATVTTPTPRSRQGAGISKRQSPGSSGQRTHGRGRGRSQTTTEQKKSAPK